MHIPLPITLTMAAGAALINLWLAIRVGQARRGSGISVGAGENPLLLARMRAHANFGENTPFVLILLGLIELAAGSRGWLWVVGLAYLIGRILHPFGMEDSARLGWRKTGFAITFAVLLILAAYALYLTYTLRG